MSLRIFPTRNSVVCTFAAVAMTALASSSTFGQEWTRFRGPDGSGVSDAAGLPTKWSDADYNWKINLPGTGHSSPVLWGDHIFVTTADKDAAKRSILCIKAADGSVIWKHDYDLKAFHINGDNSFASSSPAVDKDYVYVASTAPEQSTLSALSHDGKEVWSVDLGSFVSQHGAAPSPIVFHDTVFLAFDQEGPGSYVIAVDRNTGKQRWKIDRKTAYAASATPCIYEPKGKPPQVVFSSRGEGLTGYDVETGKLLWQANDVYTVRVNASPIVAGDLILGTCGEGSSGKMLVAIRPGADGEKPKVVWKTTQNVPNVPTGLVKGNLLFLWHDTGAITCLRADTGEQVWHDKVPTTFYASPVCAGGNLYCISRKGDVFVVAATEKFQLISQESLNEGSHATAAIADGRIYFRTFSHLYSLGGKKS